MKTKKLPTAAPMPKREEDINKNSMKLYSYLVCIAGLANYPEHTRMFRQKNLMLAEIKRTIGLDPETIKLYLYYLEQNGLIKYQGESKFNLELALQEYSTAPERRKTIVANAKEIWKIRNSKEKNGVYHIPRPDIYTPIPEETLEKLNKVFDATELEIKLYLLCCAYRDDCAAFNKPYKFLTLEDIRDILGRALHNETDSNIKHGLAFLRGLGLIEFTLKKGLNRKGLPQDIFKLEEVNYYIANKYENNNAENDELDDEETVERVKKGFNNN